MNREYCIHGDGTIVGGDMDYFNHATELMLKWVDDHPKKQSLRLQGNLDGFLIFRADKAHLERCDLEEFEEWFRTSIPLFDGKIYLADVNQHTIKEFDDIRSIEKWIKK